MRTTVDQFHVMRGHVEDGCEIVSPSGKIFTIKATMDGWQLVGPDSLPCSGNLRSAAEVEFFVVNGLATN